MLTGKRTDQIKVWGNTFGIAAKRNKLNTNAQAQSNTDKHCERSWYGPETCRNAIEYQSGVPADGTFVDRLFNHGYNVTLNGKMHVGAGLDEYPGKIHDFPFAAEPWDSMARYHSRPLGPVIGTKGVEPHSKTRWTVPDDLPQPARPYDYKTANDCRAAISGGIFSSDKPQFLYCSLLVPHPKYQSNSTYMDLVKGLNFSYPEQIPWGQVHPYDLFAIAQKKTGDADQTAKDSPETIEHFRHVYFSMIREADELLGSIVDALDSAPGNVRDDVYIVFLSDHGDQMVEHRMDGKNNMYEAAARVPIIINGPGIAKQQEIGTLVSLADIYPTLMHLAHVQKPTGLEGYSLMDLVQHETPLEEVEQRVQSQGGNSTRKLEKGPLGAYGGGQEETTRADDVEESSRPDYIVAQYHSAYSVTGQFMVRQGDWKLITYGSMPKGEADFPPQLFNIPKDPWELHDMSREHPEVVSAMSKILDEHMDWRLADAESKEFNRWWFKKYVVDKRGGSKTCMKTMQWLFGPTFNSSDASRTASWLGESCD